MNNKITESILGKTVNTENSPKEADLGKAKEQTGGKHASMEISLRRNYNAISKNGDTLEISEAGKLLGVHTEMEDLTPSGRNSIACSTQKIPDVALAGYSKTKLKQLYASNKITKQQYERMLKKMK
ncbi:MAG: hypothetical protein HFI69_05960 [Lachnospiraceae bacterium]|jgi:hypothetical protein|nr:hypothetical protein [Lachnospiraceae bacterium]